MFTVRLYMIGIAVVAFSMSNKGAFVDLVSSNIPLPASTSMVATKSRLGERSTASMSSGFWRVTTSRNT